MTPEGFEPATPASERPQTDAFDRAVDGIARNNEDAKRET
jgi:hypothetical protein